MATWDSAYLLALFNRLAGRPTTDSIGDPSKYQRLSEAQNEVIADMAGIIPSVLYPAVAYTSIPTMTTTDNQLFTFGTDSNGYNITPLGHVQIYASLADYPTNPLAPYVDYMPVGGTGIRTLNNSTLSTPLYWVGITNPSDIDATHQPTLFPEASRELIAIRAAYNFGQEGNRFPQLADQMAARYGQPLANNKGRFAWWCTAWRTQYPTGGAIHTWTGMQLALGSQFTSQT